MAPGRRLTLIVTALLILAVMTLFVLRWHSSQSHPGGDPNGTVLTTMEGIDRAVPLGATGVSVQASDTQWLPACSLIANSHAGWNKASVYVRFSDRNPGSLIDRQIAGGLERSGWVPVPMRITRGQGLVPHWVRAVNAGEPIDAFAYAVPRWVRQLVTDRGMAAAGPCRPRVPLNAGWRHRGSLSSRESEVRMQRRGLPTGHVWVPKQGRRM